MTKRYTIKEEYGVVPFNSTLLKYIVVISGPITVAVHVTTAFQLYQSGVFYEKGCGSNETLLNHDVSLVGYSEKDGELFWILKNSWGPTWGIDGYMHISARDNNCGVQTEPSFVVF